MLSISNRMIIIAVIILILVLGVGWQLWKTPREMRSSVFRGVLGGIFLGGCTLLIVQEMPQPFTLPASTQTVLGLTLIKMLAIVIGLALLAFSRHLLRYDIVPSFITLLVVTTMIILIWAVVEVRNPTASVTSLTTSLVAFIIEGAAYFVLNPNDANSLAKRRWFDPKRDDGMSL